MNNHEIEMIKCLPDWYISLKNLYLQSSFDPHHIQKIISFLEAHKYHPQYITCLLEFKDFINQKNNPHRFPRSEKKHLILDAYWVTHRKEFKDLNRSLDELIKESGNRHTSFSLTKALFDVFIEGGRYLVEHPLESTIILFSLFSLVQAMPATKMPTLDERTGSEEPVPCLEGTEPSCQLSVYEVEPRCDIIIENPFMFYSLEDIKNCENKLQEMRSYSPFMEWAKSSPIFIDPRLPSSTEVQKARDACQQALLEILNEPSFPHLLTSNSLKIILISPETAGLSVSNSKLSTGMYSLQVNQIAIIYQPEYTKDDYKKALKNEFFSHQIGEKNLKLKKAAKENLLLPFLNIEGKIDKVLYSQLEASLNKAFETVKKYKEMLLKDKLYPEEKEALEKLYQISSLYTPKHYPVSREELKAALEINFLKKSDKQGFFEPGQNYPSNLPKSFVRKKNNLIFSQHCKFEPNEFNQASCLINDLIMQFNAIDNPEGAYTKQRKEKKLSELASFIFELPTEVQKALFPDYYAFICHFFAHDPSENHITFDTI